MYIVKIYSDNEEGNDVEVIESDLGSLVEYVVSEIKQDYRISDEEAKEMLSREMEYGVGWDYEDEDDVMITHFVEDGQTSYTTINSLEELITTRG